MKIDGSRVFGSVMALDFIAKQIGLYPLLGEHAKVIMALVFCHCHDYQSVVKAERWFKKTDLSQILGIGEVSEKMLRDALAALDKIDQLALQKSIFENVLRFSGVKPSSVVYDVTNTYFTGTCAKLGKQGKDKEGVKGRALIQIGLVVTKEHAFPIFHQVHPGNIHDSKIFDEAVVHLKQFGISGGTIVYDRGITAKNSVWELSGENWKVIAGMPMHRGIKKILSKMDLGDLESYRNRIEQGVTTFYVTTTSYTFGKVRGKLIVLLNPRKKQSQKEARIRNIVEAQRNFLAKKDIEPKFKVFLTKDGNVNSHAIKREEKLDGLSFIFTNGKFSRQEIVRLYFEKDLIEKSFHAFKGVLSLRAIRMWLDENVKAHVLVCYLGYTLLATFRFLLYKNRQKSKLDGISVEEALDELADVYRVYFHRDGLDPETNQLSKLVTLSSRQERILLAISKDLVM